MVERKVEAGPGPGQGERDAVGGQGTFGVRECGDQGQCVASDAGPSAVENFPLEGDRLCRLWRVAQTMPC
ncbi:hypothetical protein ACFVQ0_34580 [Streptomyces sp. NPDC057900]|uniref:hypothetical protein n=1 Tax=Streptomyces sp. NPDC057900 TaxID=3346274 RepID=UPI0036EE9248